MQADPTWTRKPQFNTFLTTVYPELESCTLFSASGSNTFHQAAAQHNTMALNDHGDVYCYDCEMWVACGCEPAF